MLPFFAELQPLCVEKVFERSNVYLFKTLAQANSVEIWLTVRGTNFFG